jgi:hypothetical protein
MSSPSLQISQSKTRFTAFQLPTRYNVHTVNPSLANSKATNFPEAFSDIKPAVTLLLQLQAQSGYTNS